MTDKDHNGSRSR